MHIYSKMQVCVCLERGVLPVITVSKLHVHAVAAQKRLAVERCVDVWWMGNGLAHHDHTAERRLFKTTEHSCGTAVTHLQVPCAVQDLQEQPLSLCYKKSDSRSALVLKEKLFTFQPADLRLTVRPRFVTVHFILMKKSLSVFSSLPFFPMPAD